MEAIGRIVVFAIAMLVALSASWATPATAQETSGEFREALNGLHSEMNALTLEIENFRINSRYCKPPQIPSKAEAQAALDELAARAEALNQRYNALKQSLKDFARNPRVAAELMLRDVDPTAEGWWRSYEAARRRMSDALARKRAALARAPEVDCSPKPKPQPAVTTGGFQAPALPQRPSIDALGMPTLPTHFCSWDDYWKFINEVINPIYNKAAEDAERVARFRTEVEQAVNDYVQNDRPVPADLIARRRQAIADVEQANRRMRETEDLRNRAKAIPVIDCRQPQQEPPRTEPPPGEPESPATEPGPKFDDDSPLDGIRKRAWAQLEAMKTAYDRCDPEAYERALREFEKLIEEAKLARGAAQGAGEFSNVAPMEAKYLVEALRSLLEQRRWQLLDLKRKCNEPSRAQPQTTPSQTGFIPPTDRRMAVILEEHNKARAEVGSPPLQWDPALAAGAADYARQLTTLGRVHAPRTGREDVRENLLQSLRDQRSPKEMVGVWTAERRHFRPGVFPNVSATGNWADVGHYTQLIWPTTTRLGCAIHSDAKYDWTVCRYSPPGNRDGTPVLANDAASGVAPATSTTPTTPPEPPQPPPPPKASDPAPEGDEANHPLIGYFFHANTMHFIAVSGGDTDAAEKEMAKMRYALRELRKRLKTAKAAGPYSTVDAGKLEGGIKLLERMIKTAERRVPEDASAQSPPPRR